MPPKPPSIETFVGCASDQVFLEEEGRDCSLVVFVFSRCAVDVVRLLSRVLLLVFFLEHIRGNALRTSTCIEA